MKTPLERKIQIWALSKAFTINEAIGNLVGLHNNGWRPAEKMWRNKADMERAQRAHRKVIGIVNSSKKEARREWKAMERKVELELEEAGKQADKLAIYDYMQ